MAYGYTSTVDVATSANAGLVGLLVVAAKGQLDDSPKAVQVLPKGVDAMVPLYWQVRFHECGDGEQVPASACTCVGGKGGGCRTVTVALCAREQAVRGGSKVYMWVRVYMCSAVYALLGP